MIEHKTISLADQVFEHLENDILSGKYKRGEILTESKLSAELGVSRTPIREALRRLEQEHIIEESGKGSVVIGISEKDLEDIFMIRKSLECQAAALAAQNRTDEQLKSLKETLEFQEFYLSKNDPDQIKLMDSRFHEALYKLSGSTAFYDTLVLESSSRATASVAEHRKIYEAIEAKNTALAAKYASEHVENAYKHIMRKD